MFDVDEEGVIDHLDIVNHIIADKGLRKSSTYRESFEILSEERLIPKVLSDRLSDLAGFRNILVPHISEIRRELKDPEISTLWLSANSLHQNFYENWLPEETVKDGMENVRKFVKRIKELNSKNMMG